MDRACSGQRPLRKAPASAARTSAQSPPGMAKRSRRRPTQGQKYACRDVQPAGAVIITHAGESFTTKKIISARTEQKGRREAGLSLLLWRCAAAQNLVSIW